VDVALDPVGIAQDAALRCILLKGCSVIGVRAGEAGRQDAAMRARELEALSALASQGIVRPFVSQRFALQDCAQAMRMLEERRAIGRIALVLGADEPQHRLE
jgi:NADPH2:quinone reductase